MCGKACKQQVQLPAAQHDELALDSFLSLSAAAVVQAARGGMVETDLESVVAATEVG